LGKAGGPTEAFLGKHLLEFTLGYVLLFSPILTLGGAWLVLRRLRQQGRVDCPETLLAVMGLVPIAFFSLAMIRGSFPDPKWANVGFLSFFLLLGAALDQLWQTGRRFRVKTLLGVALALNATAVAVVAVQTWRPFFVAPEGGDPTAQIVGWDVTGRQVADLLAQHQLPQPRYVISFLYPLASQLSLHMPSRPLTHSLKRPERNLWSPVSAMRPGETILVCSGRECRWLRRLVRDQFGWGIKPLGTVETVKWGVTRHSVTVMTLEPLPSTAPGAAPPSPAGPPNQPSARR
jgi:hypothetical protein